jgi:hypothetical protein
MGQRKRSWLTRREKVELFEQIRREHEFAVGTIAGVSRKLGVHRRMVREALRSAEPANASASLLGSVRRCRLARVASALASRRDFLQGTFEKIRFQCLVRHHSFQLRDLLTQLPFLGIGRRA